MKRAVVNGCECMHCHTARLPDSGDPGVLAFLARVIVVASARAAHAHAMTGAHHTSTRSTYIRMKARAIHTDTHQNINEKKITENGQKWREASKRRKKYRLQSVW